MEHDDNNIADPKGATEKSSPPISSVSWKMLKSVQLKDSPYSPHW